MAEKDDDSNRFAWGPGEVQYEDPITGEWKWLGEPDPKRVKAVQAPKKSKDAKLKQKPKVQVHIHRK